MCDKSRQRCCTDTLRVTLPQCPVFDCCSNFKKAFYKLANSASSNGLATVSGYLSAGAPMMTRVSATIIQSTINSKPAYGYFVPGVGNNVITGFGSGTMAVAPYSHEVNWGPAGPINLNAPTPFGLKMQFPAVSGLRDTLRYWIRFRYTDVNCVTCDTVVAFTRIRYKLIILDGGVLEQEPLKRGGVGVLERRDVLVEECAGLRLGRLGDLVGSGGRFGQPCAGALQPAFHRHRRGAEHHRDLGGGERQHVAQDQDRPLPGRQVLQAGDERQPQSLARRDDGGGIS